MRSCCAGLRGGFALPTVADLQVHVGADVSDAERGLSSLGAKIGSAGSALATAFGGAAIAGIAALGTGLAASTAAAAGFESRMSAVKAVSGATADEMSQLSTLALDLGAKTSFSASEAAQGIEELVKAGVSIGDVMGGAASASLSLAAAGAISVGEAAEIAANAMNQFNLKGTDLEQVANVIAGAANASAIDVNDFKFSLAAVGAVANTVGFDFEETAVAIALLGQAGIKGSDAGTSLKTMFLNLQPTTKEQIGLFRQLGLLTEDGANKFFDATGRVKSMAEVSGTLQDALKGQTQQQKLATLETIFGSDAIRAAAVFANEGAEGFREMAQSMGKVTAEAVAAERLNNLKGDLEQLSGALETAGIKIGTAFLPGLRSIVQGSTEIVNQAAPVLESFARDAASAIQEASRQIRDAWGTAKQAFAGEWLPSDDIPPFVNAVGQAATAAGKFATELAAVGAKANELGTMDSLNRGMSSLKTNSDGIARNVEGLSSALERLTGAAGGSEGRINLLAAAVRTVAAGFENAVAATSIVVDSVVQMGRVFVDFQTILLSTGKALVAWATGNKEAQLDAARVAAEAFVDMTTSSIEWAGRTAQSAGQVGAAFAGVGEAAGVLDATVGANIASTTAQVSDGADKIAASMQAGMAQARTAADTELAGVATAAEANMAAATAAVEAQAPAMAAAAEEGASGAVSAVEGQQGAASSAGQSLGQALGSGLEGGILAYAGRVAAAAAQMVSNAIAAARGPEGADAQSPSKKTRKLGEDMAEGLEIGLNKSDLGEAMIRKIRDFIAASREYIPTAGEIARVEREIADIREQSQTEALFRAEKMITLDSEVLRLTAAQVTLERDLLPLRQELAAVEREIADVERGSLAQRTRLLQIDGEQARNRLTSIGLQRELLDLSQAQETHALRVGEAEREFGEVKARHEREAVERGRALEDLDQKALILRRDMASAERALLPIRQRLADASQRAADIERGSLADRQNLIGLDGQQAQIRLRQIDLEKQLIGLAEDDPRAEAIRTQLDALGKQDRMLALEAERIRTTNEVASIGARLRQEALDEQVRRQERTNQRTKDQSDLLDAQRNVISANEAITKAAQERDLRSREALVRAIQAEGRATDERVKAIEQQIAKLEQQNKAMALEAEYIKTSNDVAAVGSRIKREGLADQVRGYEQVVGAIKGQIDTLGAERAVFEANEAIIKNATENEIAYRNRLIAVFTAEGKPIADRITTGRALLEQLHNEGRISDELYNAVKRVTDQAAAAGVATSGLASSAQVAAPALSTAASQADRMAQEAADLAYQASRAKGDVLGLSSALSGFGRSTIPGFSFGGMRAGGGPTVGGVSYLVGEEGPEIFTSRRSGQIIPADVTRDWMGGRSGSSDAPQVIRLDVAIGGHVAKQIVIEGYDLAVRRGWTPGGLTG